MKNLLDSFSYFEKTYNLKDIFKLKENNYSLLDIIWIVISFYEKNLLKNAKKKGSFFTNKEIVLKIIDNIFSNYEKKEILNLKILEPANGVGIFVFVLLVYLEEKKGFNNEELLQIIENNITTIEIDKEDSDFYMFLLNYFFQVKGFKNIKNTHKVESFFNEKESYDIIIGNPPYGLSFKKEKDYIKELLYGKKDKIQISNDSYGLFFLYSIYLLKENGKLGFITPDSFLNIKSHYGMRHYMLGYIEEVILCPKNVFKNPFTNNSPGISSCITFLSKKENIQEIILNDNINNLYKKGYKFLENEIYKLDKKVINNIFLNPINKGINGNNIISNILNNVDIKLKNYFNSTMGIKTANNKFFIKEKKEKGWKDIFFKGTSKDEQAIKSPICGYINIEKLKEEKQKNTSIPPANFLEQNEYKIGVPEIGHNGEIRAFVFKEGFVSNSIWIYKLKKYDEEELFFFVGLLNSNLYRKISNVYSNGIRIEKNIIDNFPIIKIKLNDKKIISNVAKGVFDGNITLNNGLIEINNIIDNYLI